MARSRQTAALGQPMTVERENSLKALRELIPTRWPVIFRHFMTRWRVEREDHTAWAADMTQEVLIKAVRAAGSFHEDSNLNTWLISVARNHGIDVFRRTRRKPVLEPLDELLEVDDGVQIKLETMAPSHEAQVEAQITIQQILRQLSPEQRVLVELRFRQGLAYDEIAVQIDLPIGTVKSRINRLRQRCQELKGGWDRKIKQSKN